MKPFYLSIFLILVIFVITSKASIKNSFTYKEAINAGADGYKVWFLPVTGYDKNDEKNGYAGSFGDDVTGITIDGRQAYTVHILNEEQWFKKINGSDRTIRNGYAGYEIGKSIDGVAIADNVEYTVHIKNGDWLDPVIGDVNDLNDIAFFEKEKGDNNKDNNKPVKYAGEFGKAIDAVMIKNRTYTTSFFSSDKCSAQGGQCIPRNESSNCNGVYDNLCVDNINNVCCMNEVVYTNDNNDYGVFKIIIFILILIILALVLYYCYRFLKKSMEKNISETLKDIQIVPPDEKIFDDTPPPYDEAVNNSRNNEASLNNQENNEEPLNNQVNDEEPMNDQGNNSSDIHVRRNSLKQRQVRIYPNPPINNKS